MARILDRLKWWVDVQPKLSPIAKSLLALQVLDLVNADLQHWYSVHSMADMLKVSVRSVQRAQQELESEGFIRRTRRYRSGSQYRESDIVTVLLDHHPP